jgi:hypothetical protein
MLPKRDLNGVQDFDENDDQQDPVEEENDIVGQIAGEQILSKEDDFSDEQRPGDRGKQQSESDVNGVFDVCEDG